MGIHNFQTRMSTGEPAKKWKFSELLEETGVRDRWEKVRKYFFLRESTYDMTNRCNIRCEGCYYYEGEKQFAHENSNLEEWDALLKSEKKRGITFVVLAGAEPSLVPERCKVCYKHIPNGAIATNGLKRISSSIGYKIHISVWGNDETSQRVRGTKRMLERQLENYRNDSRAVFIYTFTNENMAEAVDVTRLVAKNGGKISFNMFSAPVGYQGFLTHTKETLFKTRETMQQLLKEYPEHVLFSPYSISAHTHPSGLNDLFRCPYPRVNPSTDIGLGRTFRQYRTDLSWDRNSSCCVPDTDCKDCRHYAAGSAIVTSRLYRHADSPDFFCSWLDYVDTYLAVWVMGYEKGENLCDRIVPPPAL